MNFCPNYPLCAYARVGHGRVLFTRLRCGQWSCEFCAKKNAAIWRAFLAEKLPEVAETWWLLTLTAHEHRRSEALSLANIRDNLDRLFKRARRIWKGLNYVRVYEKHPTSQARHAHLVVSGLSAYLEVRSTRNHKSAFLPCELRTKKKGTWALRTWWKKMARECGMGYQVECQRVDLPKKAMFYVTKYLTKSQQELGEKGLRHVQTTRAIGSPKPDGAYNWTIVGHITARDFMPGEEVIDLQTGLVIDKEYWSEFDAYPVEMN